MKCPFCQAENRDDAKICKKCSSVMTRKPLWRPTGKWYAGTLAIISIALIILFFTLNSVLKPYMRQIPRDITPWMKDVPATSSVG